MTFGFGTLIGWLLGFIVGVYVGYINNKKSRANYEVVIANGRAGREEIVKKADQMRQIIDDQATISQQKDKTFNETVNLCNALLKKAEEYEGQNNQLAEDLKQLKNKHERLLASLN